MTVLNRFAYARAATIEEALGAIGDECRPLAGGTDLLALIKEGLAAPDRLVDLKRIAGLDAVREEEGALRVGAMVRLSSLLSNTAIAGRDDLASLLQALSETASPQLRHVATLGGNLLQRPRCWYFRNALAHCLRKGGSRCYAFRGENKYHAILGGGPCYIVHPSDPAVALLALGASVVLAGRDGSRTVPLDEFYLLPRRDAHSEVILAADELLTEIVVPAPLRGARGTYVKVAERQAWDFCLVSAAIQLAMEGGRAYGARVALGGVAPAPWRAREAEVTLIGATLTDEVIARAAEAATAGARPLAHNAYKIDLTQGVVRQALRRLRDQAA